MEHDAYQIELLRDQPAENLKNSQEYQLAQIHIQHIRHEFNLYTFSELISWLQEFVVVEGPIYFEEAAKRITDAAGITKLGSRIRYTITQALAQAQSEHKIVVKDDFLWSPDMEQPVVRDRRKLPVSYRKLSLIAPEEICLAVSQIVTQAIAISEEEAIPLVAKQLGFSRVTDEMRQELSEAIGKTIQSGLISFKGTDLIPV